MQQIQGIKSKRTCTIVDHDQKEISYICTYETCDQTCRWLCAQCILMKTHNHNSNDQLFLQDQKQFLAYLDLKQNTIENNDQQVSYNILEVQEQINNLIDELNNLKKLLQMKISNNNLQSLNYLISKAKQDLFNMSNDEVNLAIQTNFKPFEIDEYIQINKFVKECRWIFETFSEKNQTQSDLFKQHYVCQQEITFNARQNQQQNEQSIPINKINSQIIFIQNTEQPSNIQLSQSRIQYQQKAQPSNQSQVGVTKSPIDKSRIRFEQPQPIKDEKGLKSKIIQNQPTTNQYTQNQIKSEEQIINNRNKQIPFQPTILKVYDSPLIKQQIQSQNQINAPIGPNNIQNQPHCSDNSNPYQQPIDRSSSSQSKILPKNSLLSNQQQQIKQIKPNQLNQQYQQFKK